jgi:hypothetical protein
VNSSIVRIHSLLADGARSLDSRGYNAIALWYWCRATDVQGSGRITFTLAGAAKALDRSINTIKRYLASGLKLGFWRSVDRDHGRVSLYLASRDNVCIRQGLESWGVTGNVTVDRLKDIRSAATDVATAALQKSSEYLAKKGLKKRDRSRVITSDALTSCLSSQRASVRYIGKRCLFVGENAIATGVSQKGIGAYLGRSRHTIKKRLSAGYRRDRGLDPLYKKQLVKALSADEQLQLETDSEVHSIDRVFRCKGKIYKACCNLYELGAIELASCRVARILFRRKVEEVLFGGEN